MSEKFAHYFLVVLVVIGAAAAPLVFFVLGGGYAVAQTFGASVEEAFWWGVGFYAVAMLITKGRWFAMALQEWEAIDQMRSKN